MSAGDEKAGEKGGSEPEFRVDEGWKESVARERGDESPESAQAAGSDADAGGANRAQADLRVFVAGLYAGALMALGEVEHPVTRQKKLDLREAEYLIDTVAMLKDKTRGNLTEEEERYVSSALHDLRLRYAHAVESGPARGEAPKQGSS